MLESLRDIPIVGDMRGVGYFRAIELVKDRETKASFDDDESEWLLRGFLSGELYRRGLICRADDRGDPVIQLAPPLITTAEQFGEIARHPAPGARGGVERDSGSRSSMLTVRELIADLDVTLHGGEAGLDAPVRWVHSSELPDPTPVAVGRRDPPHDRDAAHRRRPPAGVRRAARTTTASPASGSGRASPTTPSP